jgi:trehalose synthase
MPIEVPISPQTPERFRPLLGDARYEELVDPIRRAAEALHGRVVWTVNSTAVGGGVAEMLRPIIAYARGAGVDARWIVIDGAPDFFQLTKRLHHALHGSLGDGSPLGPRERARYEKVMEANATELAARLKPRDVVILHDPQTLGMAPYLARAGALVVWRSHVGHDSVNDQVDLAWDFLAPYLDDALLVLMSRASYFPKIIPPGRRVVLQPSIDPFSAKNQDMDDATVRAILVQTGLIEGPPGDGDTEFTREDGSPGRVDRNADLVRSGRAPTWDRPLVVQVSRWDPLKDPVGVMEGFAAFVDAEALPAADLVLAGPNVTSVPDDPEAPALYAAVLAAWRSLPHAVRHHVHLACLPMRDPEENAAIVNALQRHAAVIVQKSLHEGFGLTVTEAMWKGRPVVASRVGGMQDQIHDGHDGLLLDDPHDPVAFADALRRVLLDPPFARELGEHAHQTVLENRLGISDLSQYASLLSRIDPGA